MNALTQGTFTNIKISPQAGHHYKPSSFTISNSTIRGQEKIIKI